jgi:hypothetical protein
MKPLAPASVAPIDHEIATVTLAGRRFGIACGTDEAALRDPVAGHTAPVTCGRSACC